MGRCVCVGGEVRGGGRGRIACWSEIMFRCLTPSASAPSCEGEGGERGGVKYARDEFGFFRGNMAAGGGDRVDGGGDKGDKKKREDRCTRSRGVKWLT